MAEGFAHVPWLITDPMSGTNNSNVWIDIIQQNNARAGATLVDPQRYANLTATCDSDHNVYDTIRITQQGRPEFLTTKDPPSFSAAASATSLSIQHNDNLSNATGLYFHNATTTSHAHFTVPTGFRIVPEAGPSAGQSVNVTSNVAFAVDHGAYGQYNWRIVLSMPANTSTSPIVETLIVETLTNQAPSLNITCTHLAVQATIQWVDTKGEPLDAVTMPWYVTDYENHDGTGASTYVGYEAAIESNDSWTINAEPT